MALQRIADKIADHIRKPCIAGQVAKKPGTAIDDCTVVSFSPDDSGDVVERPIAACTDTGGAGPCWQLAAGEDGCAGQTIAVVPDPSAPSAHLGERRRSVRAVRARRHGRGAGLPVDELCKTCRGPPTAFAAGRPRAA